MSLHAQGEQIYRYNQTFFHKKAQKNYKDSIDEFTKIIRSFFIFNISFFTIFVVQVLLFALFFALLLPSTILAMILASAFLTAFTYFVLLFYFQSKKPEQLSSLKEKFICVCKRSLSIPPGSAEYHLTIALAAVKLSDALYENEKNILSLPKFLNISAKLQSYFIKEDMFKLKESLLIAAIEEHLNQVKITPTDLEIHASLANIYTNLSALYLESIDKIFFSKNTKAILKNKYDTCLSSTIEEFQILNDYAPNDPWIHLQLAQSYKKLNLKKEQIKEYETIYKLCPNDNNVLFKLGALYFETKRNSKGLRIYEELKSRSFKDADLLLTYYGVYKTQEILEESI
jgi:hypothetical protein